METNGILRGQLVTIRAGRYKPSKFDGLKKVGASGVNDDGVLILNGYYPTAQPGCYLTLYTLTRILIGSWLLLNLNFGR